MCVVCAVCVRERLAAAVFSNTVLDVVAAWACAAINVPNQCALVCTVVGAIRVVRCVCCMCVLCCASGAVPHPVCGRVHACVVRCRTAGGIDICSSSTCLCSAWTAAALGCP